MATLTQTERLSRAEVDSLDPYALFADLEKHVVHPGGRRATEQLFEPGALTPGMEVLDIGCGPGTTANEKTLRIGARIRRMAWLMRGMAKAVPFLGYVVVAGRRPATQEG